MEDNKSIEELQKKLEELKVKCEQKEHKLHLLEQRGRYIRSKKDREGCCFWKKKSWHDTTFRKNI